jgi:hypothetical protein
MQALAATFSGPDIVALTTALLDVLAYTLLASTPVEV